MSVNGYLKEEELKELPGFEQVNTIPSEIEYILLGFDLKFQGGRFFVVLKDLEVKFPEYIEEIIEEISFQSIPNPHVFIRTAGIYKLGSAKAIVDYNTYMPDSPLRVIISAPSIREARDLYLALRIGNIKPDTIFNQFHVSFEEQIKISDDKPEKKWFRKTDTINI